MTQYHKFLKSWTTERGITSYLGSDKPEFQRDWKDEKTGGVRFGEPIAKPKMEIATIPMEIAEPTVSEKPTGLKIDLRMLKYKIASQASKKKLAEKLAGQKVGVSASGGGAKPKPKLSAENVGDFVKKLPREIEKEIASYIIEKDPLMEFDSIAGLATLFYVLMLIDQPNVPVGKIIYGLELTKSQNTSERLNSWNEGKRFTFNPEGIINSMPAVQSALISIMSKSKDFSVEAYYGGGVGAKKSIRAKIIWIGKKGEKNKNSLWQDFWNQNIKTLMDDTPRWNKASERIVERFSEKKISTGIARDATIEKRTLLGNALLPESSSISVNDTLKIVGKLLKKYNFQPSGYTKWKEKGSVGYIVEMMSGIFNKPKASANHLAVWNDFKKEMGI